MNNLDMTFMQHQAMPLISLLQNLGYHKVQEMMDANEKSYSYHFEHNTRAVSGSLMCLKVGATGKRVWGFILKNKNTSARFDLITYLNIKGQNLDSEKLIFKDSDILSELENQSLLAVNHLQSLLQGQFLALLEGRIWIEVTEDWRD